MYVLYTLFCVDGLVVASCVSRYASGRESARRKMTENEESERSAAKMFITSARTSALDDSRGLTNRSLLLRLASLAVECRPPIAFFSVSLERDRMWIHEIFQQRQLVAARFCFALVLLVLLLLLSFLSFQFLSLFHPRFRFPASRLLQDFSWIGWITVYKTKRWQPTWWLFVSWGPDGNLRFT